MMMKQLKSFKESKAFFSSFSIKQTTRYVDCKVIFVDDGTHVRP